MADVNGEPVRADAAARDRELVARAQAGELGAFEELVRTHQPRLFGYLYQLCWRDRDAAAELAEEALVRAWQGLARFRGEAGFRTWLYRIATNLAINRRTRARRHEPLTESLAARRQEEPDAVWERRRAVERALAALAALPDEQRAALSLYVYEEMSYEDIGATLGRSPAAVNMLIYRARIGLRRLLARGESGEGEAGQ
jgi:RNA polymerase sigma-70 factor (ECF subfamily)